MNEKKDSMMFLQYQIKKFDEDIKLLKKDMLNESLEVITQHTLYERVQDMEIKRNTILQEINGIENECTL